LISPPPRRRVLPSSPLRNTLWRIYGPRLSPARRPVRGGIFLS
jgi:hypothetical protein